MKKKDNLSLLRTDRSTKYKAYHKLWESGVNNSPIIWFLISKIILIVCQPPNVRRY